MSEILVNGYLKIEPQEVDGFVSNIKDSFEEIGLVVARDEEINLGIPVGSKVFFDSFMAKKYPIVGEIGKFQWFVHCSEVVKYEVETLSE